MLLASSSTVSDFNKSQSASILEVATFAIQISLAVDTATQEMEQLTKNAPTTNRASASSVLGADTNILKENCASNMHLENVQKDQTVVRRILGLF